MKKATHELGRRDLLSVWIALALPACLRRQEQNERWGLPQEIPSRETPSAIPYGDAVDALFDTLIPREANLAGALEAGTDELIERQSFVRFAVAQGFIRPIDEVALVAFDDSAVAARQSLNSWLDLRAQLETPNASFATISAEDRDRIVELAFADEAMKPLMKVVRAACFTAYLGAITSDVGLRQVGLPAFVNFASGEAHRGFSSSKVPSVADDYTFNRTPEPTVGDDLSLVLDAQGHLR